MKTFLVWLVAIASSLIILSVVANVLSYFLPEQRTA